MLSLIINPSSKKTVAAGNKETFDNKGIRLPTCLICLFVKFVDNILGKWSEVKRRILKCCVNFSIKIQSTRYVRGTK